MAATKLTFNHHTYFITESSSTTHSNDHNHHQDYKGSQRLKSLSICSLSPLTARFFIIVMPICR